MCSALHLGLESDSVSVSLPVVGKKSLLTKRKFGRRQGENTANINQNERTSADESTNKATTNSAQYALPRRERAKLLGH